MAIKAIDEISFSASFTITKVAPHRRVTKMSIASDLYFVLLKSSLFCPLEKLILCHSSMFSAGIHLRTY